jgi:predicted metal-dependent hydrolase
MDFLPTYKHIVNTKLKNIYLSVNADGEIVVRSPRVSLESIERLIVSKSNWINKAKEKIILKKGKAEFSNGNLTIFYLGKKVDIVLQEARKNKIDFVEDEFTLFFTRRCADMFHKTIDKFYLERAKLTLPIIVEKWSNVMELKPTRLKFRKTKTQWGSCNSKNEIQLNSSLMKLPPHLIDYVIIHELCHIKHKHHQKGFWEAVEVYCPEHKRCRKQLKEFTT